MLFRLCCVNFLLLFFLILNSLVLSNQGASAKYQLDQVLICISWVRMLWMFYLLCHLFHLQYFYVNILLKIFFLIKHSWKSESNTNKSLLWPSVAPLLMVLSKSSATPHTHARTHTKKTTHTLTRLCKWNQGRKQVKHELIPYISKWRFLAEPYLSQTRRVKSY